MPRWPDEVPNYELVSYIGAGGFGEVWLAREVLTDVPRAIKFLYKEDGSRAQREIDGVRRFVNCNGEHPHLLRILTVGETPRSFYYVMDAAQRATAHDAPYRPLTLRHMIQRDGRMPPDEGLEVIAHLVDAVRGLHAQGLCHYDIKPDNILIVGGMPRLGDLGLIGPMTEPPTRAGTLGYRAPEGRSDDLYAVGKVLYELITGRGATEFPSLPPDLQGKRRPALAAALRVANRACHTVAQRRVRSIEALAGEVQLAREYAGSWRARWHHASPACKGTIVAASLAALTAAAAAALALHARYSTHVIHTQFFDYTPPLYRPFRTTDGSTGAHPFARVGGAQLDRAGIWSWPLEAASPNLVLDARIRTGRTFGKLDIGIASTPDGAGAVYGILREQPFGLGRYSGIEWVSVRGDDSINTPYVSGHPQAGSEYAIRLIRSGDDWRWYIWPAAGDSRRPIKVERLKMGYAVTPNYLAIRCAGEDPYSSIDIADLRLVSYSAALNEDDVTRAPGWIGSGRRPASLPSPPSSSVPTGEILSFTQPMARTPLWMPMGNWCWWHLNEQLSPRPGVMCGPFSQGKQSDRDEKSHVYDGIQLLRFDGGVYSDFSATVHLRAARDPRCVRKDPFIEESLDGSFGFAFRMQDVPPSDDEAWGGAYFAEVRLDSLESYATAHLRAFHAMSLHGTDSVQLGGANNWAIGPRIAVSRDEVLRPEGCTLTLEVRGSRTEMRLNGRHLLTACDSAYASGRLALFARRLIVQFDSVIVSLD